jgi:2-methylcitrate dehydratase
MRAVHLALLTRNGQPGAPTVLTAPRWGFYDTHFGGKEFIIPRSYSSWVIESFFFKLIPAESYGISAIECAK